MADQLNLITAWRALKTENNRKELKEALSEIKKLTGYKATHGRYGEWEKGKLKPSTELINIMIQDVLKAKLGEQDLTTKQIRDVTQSVLLPLKSD